MRTSVPQTHPPGDGWLDWCWIMPPSLSPYSHEYVEAWRKEWQEVEVLRVWDMNPLMNVAGLWWRPLRRPQLEPEVEKLTREGAG